MQNIRAKIVSAQPYDAGSEAVRVFAAPVRVEDRQVTFDESNPIEVVFLPMAWNIAGETAAYVAEQVGQVGMLVFADDEPTGVMPANFNTDLPVVEFFVAGR